MLIIKNIKIVEVSRIRTIKPKIEFSLSFFLYMYIYVERKRYNSMEYISSRN